MVLGSLPLCSAGDDTQGFALVLTTFTHTHTPKKVFGFVLVCCFEMESYCKGQVGLKLSNSCLSVPPECQNRVYVSSLGQKGHFTDENSNSKPGL